MTAVPAPVARVRVPATMLHPVVVGAVGVLVINDHVLKHAWPSLLTGKLSDFAGLLFFPLLLHAWYGIVSAFAGRPRNARSESALLVAVVATGLVFTLVQLWEPAGSAYQHGLASLQWPFEAVNALVRGLPSPGLGTVALTPDPTDLIALPALLVSWRIGLTDLHTSGRRQVPRQ